MIKYHKFTLDNGLTVIHHEDKSTQLCVLNILYKVGSKHESSEKTGFAHLFEHLMFEGSAHVTEFDRELQIAGGESNAFTSNDLTNYYLSLPHNNIETGFWLESDRMFGLDFSEEALSVQKSVVIEEFKERYLNQPYGDIWLKLLPLAYKVHPYMWPTIGKEISHIENATLNDVKSFFSNFYRPNNAVLVVAGNISLSDTKTLSEKWFGPISSGEIKLKHYKPEPQQLEPRLLEVREKVPLDLIVKAYHIPERLNDDYYACDLISDILGGGKSSRFYNELVKKEKIFIELDAYLSGDTEPGLFIVEGKLAPGISFEDADRYVTQELVKIKSGIDSAELAKVINKTEANISFGNVNVLNKAMKLAYAEYLGDLKLVNTELEKYQQVTVQQIKSNAEAVFTSNNCSTIFYHAES